MPNKRWISGEMYVSYLLDLVTLTHFITFSSSAVTGFGMSPPGKRERRRGAEARFAPRRCRTGSCHSRGQRYPLCWPHLSRHSRVRACWHRAAHFLHIHDILHLNSKYQINRNVWIKCTGITQEKRRSKCCKTRETCCINLP